MCIQQLNVSNAEGFERCLIIDDYDGIATSAVCNRL